MATTGYTYTESGHINGISVGAPFSVMSRKIKLGGETAYRFYSSQFDRWFDHNGVNDGGSSEPTGAGVVKSVKNNAIAYSYNGTSLSTAGTVALVNIYDVKTSVSGGGTMSISGLIDDRFAIGGTSISITTTPDSGKVLASLTANGNNVVGGILTVTGDVTISAVFGLSSQTINGTLVSANGHLSITHIATGGTSSSKTQSEFPITVHPGDWVQMAALPGVDCSLDYMYIGDNRTSESSYRYVVPSPCLVASVEFGASFSAPRTTDVGIESFINCTVTIREQGAVSDNVPYTSGTGHKAYSLIDGHRYTITVTPNQTPCDKVMLTSYPSGAILQEGTGALTHTFTASGVCMEFCARAYYRNSSNLSVKCGQHSSADDNTWNGCTCTYTHSGLTYTFTASAAAGYAFKHFYVEDRDGTGRGIVSSNNPMTISNFTFSARIVAVFKSTTAMAEPADSDQGATHPSATNVLVKMWEGKDDEFMSAKWRSKRHVFPRPVAFNSARVYADSYGRLGPRVTVYQYESPNQLAQSRSVTSTLAVSQNAYRMPVRRPEKYVEIEVEASSPVMEIGVSTSMVGLCQQKQ